MLIDLYSRIARAADGESGGAEPATPESVLFPDEKKVDDAAGVKDEGDKAADDKAADDKAEWKEYVNDPAKSEAENAAAKAEHDKTKPAEGEKAKDDPLDRVPDDGKYALKMPDGIEVDQALLDALSPEFKGIGLTNRQAQALADKFIAAQQARAEKQTTAWGETIQKWAEEAKADKEIGGTNWDGTVTNARRAVETIGTPALKEYLNATGGGNHPELIRFMAKVGAMIREDNPATGGAGGNGKPAEAAHIMFPNDAPKGK